MQVQINEKDNDELIEMHVSMYDSPKSRYTRIKQVKKFLDFNGNKPIVNTTYDEFYAYFLHVKGREDWTLKTKRNYWTRLRSFVDFVSEVTNTFINFPRKTIRWGNGHKKGPESKQKVMSIDDVKMILHVAGLRDFKRHVQLMLLTDTGMRYSELITIYIENVDLANRKVTTGIDPGARKSGEVTYYYSSECRDLLERYIDLRTRDNHDNPYLFPGRGTANCKTMHDGDRALHYFIKQVRHRDFITPHTFRKTINTLRKRMGCDLIDRKLLLNHKINDVNVKHYTKLSHKEKLALYDRWYPY